MGFMTNLHKLLTAAFAAFFIASSAVAQNDGSVTNHAFAIGKGAGTSGFTSLLCGAGQIALGQSGADPACVNFSAGLNVLAPTALATAAVLPNTPTYANGTAGVGATLTAGSNTTLTVDGTAAPLNTVILVKNQASAFQNGVYTVTQAGSGSVPWILTRATYFDQAAEMKASSYTFITGGSTNLNSSYVLQAAVTTVGTDPLNWALFTAQGGVTSLGGAAGALTLGTGLSMAGTVLSTTAFAGVTSNYTGVNSLATTDCNKTVVLAGSAFYTFTVGAASGFATSCAVIITNGDNVCPLNGASTCRGKILAINGYASFILWPGQTFVLTNQNSVWTYQQPGRWEPLVGMIWNVNHTAGSDSSDGLGTSAGAFATMQRCVIVVESLIDFGLSNVGPTCKNVAETFTEPNVVHTHTLMGYHVISITGDTSTPDNVVWQVSGSGNTGFQCRDGGYAIVTGFKFVSTGTANTFINGGQLGVCDFGSIDFGVNSGGFDLSQSPGGAVNFFGGTISITGNMMGWILSTGEGHVLVDGATVSVPSALTFTNFIQQSAPSVVSATSMTFTGTGAGAGSTGSKYACQFNGTLGITGTTLPGATGGSATTGCQVH